MADQTSLLDLPARCLSAIMQHCSSDYHSLFSAARAHSTLRSAAAAALTSITLSTSKQDTLDNLMLYLKTHGHHVRHLDLTGSCTGGVLGGIYYNTHEVLLRGLPPGLQLESLCMQKLQVLLMHRPYNYTPGVLACQPQLTQLRMHQCAMPEGPADLLALQQLPALQELDVAALQWDGGPLFPFAGDVLSSMQSLTYLDLGRAATDTNVSNRRLWSVLQNLTALTALQDLRFEPNDKELLTTEKFAGLSYLTSLRLTGHEERLMPMQPEVLSNKPRLRHLELPHVTFTRGVGDAWQTFGCAAVVLAQVQRMQELTHLDLQYSLHFPADFAAAYAALTASSKLHYLDVSGNNLPAGAWQQMFGPGKHLPQLQVLNISDMGITAQRPGYDIDASEESPLVLTAVDVQQLTSCCPSLQQLHTQGTLCDRPALSALSALSSLHTLALFEVQPSWEEAVVACQSLRHLELSAEPVVGWGQDDQPVLLQAGLAQLTRLTGLTTLKLMGEVDKPHKVFDCQGSDCHPVWQQIQEYCRTDPRVPKGARVLQQIQQYHQESGNEGTAAMAALASVLVELLAHR